MKIDDSNNDTVLTYDFSVKEVELLLQLFRTISIPDGLGKFKDSINSYVYKSMTIDQAESLFKIGGEKFKNR